MINWGIYTWDELNTQQLYSLLSLRQNVFIIEQNCPYPELDGKDKDAFHIIAFSPTEQCCAYARIFPAGKYFENASIGRVCTSLPYRRTGLGRELMNRTLEFMDAQWAGRQIEISAQSYLIPFYQSFGFKEQGDEYLEDGIPHKRMLRMKAG